MQDDSGTEQSLRDLVAAAAHNLNTPLFSILGLTQLLLEDEALVAETRREFLTIIRRQAMQLSGIANDLRDLARLEDGAPLTVNLEPMSAGELAEDVVARAKPAARERQVSLRLSITPGLDPMKTDRPKATQILDNLLENALKYTPAGGVVTVRAEPGTSSGFARISVSDTGIGMDAESISRVFGHFPRLAPARSKGSGLGLYISKQMVRLLGGRIGVVSQPGTGSEFWIELPTCLSADGAGSQRE